MPDRHAVAEVAWLSWEQAREFAQDSIGLATSFGAVILQLSETGLSLTAASGGTAIVQSRGAVNFEDARVDQIRLVGYGRSSGAGDSVRLRDVTATAATIATVDLPQPSDAYFEGTWTALMPTSGSRRVLAEVIGNGARTQVLYRVEVQLRTLRIVRQ